MFGYFELARKRRRIEMCENLVVAALGAQGDKDGIEKQLDEWD